MIKQRHFLRAHVSRFALALALGAAAATPSFAQSGDDCAIPSDWFSGGSIPDPSDLSSGMAFDTFDSFCKFNLWAWNAFLYSMEEVTTQDNQTRLRFETYPTQDQTVAGNWPGENATAADGLMPRAGKGDHPIDAVAQAGTTGILVASANNRAVYYSQHINPVMYDQVIGADWNQAAGIFNEPVDTGLFDIGSIEYKAAWAIVDGGVDIPGAYTRSASIPQLAYITKGGTSTIGVPNDPSQITYEDVTVALIGLHVVGWVNGHTEAVWASFSPTDLVPVLSDTEIEYFEKNSSFSNNAVSDTTTAFYAGGTAANQCNLTNSAIQILDEKTQKLRYATEACQVYEYGAIPDVDTAQAGNITAIQDLNASASSVVPASLPAAGYSEVGAIWGPKDGFKSEAGSNGGSGPSSGARPTARFPTTFDADKVGITFQAPGILQGSTALSNPVIETFTQTDFGQYNCFSCHNSLQFQPSAAGTANMKAPKASMLNLSHFLMQIYETTYADSKDKFDN